MNAAFNLEDLMVKSRQEFNTIIGRMSNDSLVMLCSELADSVRKLEKHGQLRDKLLSKQQDQLAIRYAGLSLIASVSCSFFQIVLACT